MKQQLQSEEVKNNCSIRLCTCSNSFQDQVHGRGRRVHNKTKQNKPPSERGWRCTACGRS